MPYNRISLIQILSLYHITHTIYFPLPQNLATSCTIWQHRALCPLSKKILHRSSIIPPSKKTFSPFFLITMIQFHTPLNFSHLFLLLPLRVLRRLIKLQTEFLLLTDLLVVGRILVLPNPICLLVLQLLADSSL